MNRHWTWQTTPDQLGCFFHWALSYLGCETGVKLQVWYWLWCLNSSREQAPKSSLVSIVLKRCRWRVWDKSAFVWMQGSVSLSPTHPLLTPPLSLSLSDTNTRNTHSYLQSTPLPGQIWQIKRAATTLAAHCSCRELCCEECSDSHLASISDMSCFGVLLEADVLFTAGLAKQGFIRGRALHIRVTLTAIPTEAAGF